MTTLKLLIIVLNFSSVFWDTAKADGSRDSYNKNEEVRTKLLKDYDRKALPQRDMNDTVTVKLNMNIRSFFLDDEHQILTVNSWIMMQWKDQRLTWDYKDYGGLKMAHFGDNELWKPDLHVYNNAEITEMDHYGNVHFLVYSTGQVLWVPPATTKTPCKMDLKFWPFDEHRCTIIMGSWTTNGWQLNFDFLGNRTQMATWAVLESSNSWKLLEAQQNKFIEIYGGPERYISLEFSFRIKRTSPTFSSVVVVPAIVIPLLLLVQFILPVDHPKRLSIGFVCSLLTFLEMLFLKASLPKLGTSVPLIVSYYSQCLIMVLVTIILSAILSRLAHPQNPLLTFPPQELLKRLLTGPVAVVLCLKNHASKVGLSGKFAEDGEVLEGSNEPNYSHEWLLVAKAVDRIAFIVFICIFSISLIAYISHLN